MDELEAVLRIENHMRVHGIGEYPHIKIAEALLLAIAALKRPQVVRCKDCKHYEETTGKDSGKPCGYGKCVNRMTMLMAIVYDEDFCSYGERRTDA